jgi:hypothetical protein
MNKKDKRNMNEKNFITDKVMGNIKLKNYFHERKKINGKDQRNVILKYKRKTEECKINFESDEEMNN